MSYNPISGFALQVIKDNGQVAADYYLKFYEANSTTPLSMATDASGSVLLAKAKINDQGMPISNQLDNTTVFIPYLNKNYRLVVYTSEADADANNTAAAFVNIASVELSASAGDITANGGYLEYGGTANTITLTNDSGSPSAYSVGQLFRFRATATNTGAVTINVNGAGAKSAVTIDGSALPASYLATDKDTTVTYDGTNFVVYPPVQSSTTDATADKVMITGAGGWCSTTRELTTDITSLSVSGIYGYDAGTTGSPDTLVGGGVIVAPRSPLSTSIRQYNIAFTDDDNLYIQKNTNGVLGDWGLANQNTFYQRVTTGAGSPNINLGFDGNTIEEGVNSRANTISGGGYNLTINAISGPETRYATIGGGYDNFIDGNSSTEDIDAAASTIAGGAHHVIKSTHSTIAGGSYGEIGAGSPYSSILGGTQNVISDNCQGAVIGGGLRNEAAAEGASVLTGRDNRASGVQSVAIGVDATASGAGAVAWRADSATTAALENSRSESMALSFKNGFRFIGDGVYIGNSNTNLVPSARVEIESVTPSTTAGNAQLARIAGTRFGVRMHSDTVMVFERASSGTWSSTPLISFDRTNGNVGIGKTPSANSILSISGLPTYADNASAISGGLTTGDIYKTSGGFIRIVV